MIRALFFDAAGTLIEPAEPVADVYGRHFLEHGWEVRPPEIRSAFASIFSKAPNPDYANHPDGDAAERGWWREVVFGTLRSCGVDPVAGEGRGEECFEALFNYYDQAAAWSVFPEVLPVMEASRREGFLLAVVSNFDRRLHRILDGAGLSFDLVLPSADARSRKPDPAIFRQALRQLDLLPGEAIHAGDSAAADVAGARAAGIGSFHLNRPHNNLRDFLGEALARRGK